MNDARQEAGRSTAAPRRYTVEIVSADRSLLRQLARFLDEFGFDARTVADPRCAAADVDSLRPDFLIVDAQLPGNQGLQLCRTFCGQDRASYVYTLLLVASPDPQQLLDAFAAGVDDFLARTIVHGEVLARLRAGARVLEFERRAREQARLDPATGLPAGGALEDHLRRRLSAAAAERRTVAVVAADLDGLAGVNARYGRSAGDELLRQAAARLRETPPARTLYSLGGGRFAAVWDDASMDDVVRWAEEARARLAADEFVLGERHTLVTASLGVAACGNGEHTAAELLDEALQALGTAKNSGRDCVVRFGQFAEEEKRWRELAAPGRMFELTTARDVMTPCTATLRLDDPVGLAAALWERTRLPAIPVVDEHDKLVGMVIPPDPKASGRTRATAVRDLLTPDAPRFEQDATFGELVDFFIREKRPLVFVVRDDRPQGIVVRSTLAALIEPVSADQFAPRGPYRGDSEYLLVDEPATAE